ncbi:aminotransferase class I/II-fold pyridoxal phosphate-dependent enzyme [Halobacillus naozhouensis]|uniref:Aminotransferase class I/II-fold pyridoxal phosphate-dependent enzyme n=1 Tax=Halobacillus naozhouensis TaxID=554880 RepID=A0ABY8IVS2_9BACI|nr:aminotransferase class I/II-fold pyridoxal phosphate-dependent enzyme [Halobacillus naozhouensis]WFT74294.1 aminotransferase class I/II-fold pyridoxal phosphate-dependent enzyme [Halobacillus naozhouensis]
MQKKERVFLSSPHMSGNEQKYIQEAFDLNWIAPLGNNVNEFEKDIAEYNGMAGASVVTSGTAAIHLALRLLDVSEGDSVICSSLTFVASANPIMYQGAEPIFIDSEPDTWNMSPQALDRALRDAGQNGNLPKAAIIVNLYGQSAKINELKSVCDRYSVPIIEDAAESLGSEYNGQKSGTFGDFGIYSFNGNKIITTSGGGALVSNNKEALEKSRFLSTQARDKALHYQHSELGYNYRMSNIVAGIGRAQLEVLDTRVEQRRGAFRRYQESLGSLPGFNFMPELEGTKSNRWLTALTINPDQAGISHLDIIDALAERNIEARPVWKPLHLQPIFEGKEYYPHDINYSVSDKLFKYGLCLPSGSNMTLEQQDSVIGIIQELVKLKQPTS